MVRLLAFSGSARDGSYNQKLVQIAAQGALQTGAEVTLINLADFPMPLFNQDLEQSAGMPQYATTLKDLFINHDGFLIASPEYNGSFSPLLKNALDWVSRRGSPDVPYQPVFKDKFAAIMAASPGALGGMRGLVMLRMLLNNLAINVLSAQQTVPFADKAFHADGLLADETIQKSILNLGANLAQTVQKLTQEY